MDLLQQVQDVFIITKLAILLRYGVLVFFAIFMQSLVFHLPQVCACAGEGACGVTYMHVMCFVNWLALWSTVCWTDIQYMYVCAHS